MATQKIKPNKEVKNGETTITPQDHTKSEANFDIVKRDNKVTISNGTKTRRSNEQEYIKLIG